jgi:hypothetical protein
MPGLLVSIRCSLLVLAFTPCATLRAQQPAPIDWNELRDETVQVLADNVRINTTNPPGAGRANLYARLRGDGTKKAVALVHHMDLVPSEAKYWSGVYGNNERLSIENVGFGVHDLDDVLRYAQGTRVTP